ncbi:MAG: hypothetical protein FD167_4521, partial [bacterium]
PDFFAKTGEIAQRLNPENPTSTFIALLHIMDFETIGTFDPRKRNPISGATGLIQFTEKTARDLGTTLDKLAEKSQLEQLDYVKLYFGLPIFSTADFSNPNELAAAVIERESVGKGDSYVIATKGELAYSQNYKVLDTDNNEKITREEYVKLALNYVGGKSSASSPPPEQEFTFEFKDPAGKVITLDDGTPVRITVKANTVEEAQKEIQDTVVAKLPAGSTAIKVEGPPQIVIKEPKIIPIDQYYGVWDGSTFILTTTDKNLADKELKRIIEERYVQDALKKSGLTLLNKVDEQGRQLARKGEDVRYFDTTSKDFKQIEGPNYVTQDIYGESNKAVTVITTIDKKTDKILKGEVTQRGVSVEVDEQTLKQIEAYKGNIQIREVEIIDGGLVKEIEYYKDGFMAARDSYGKNRVIEQFGIIYLDQNGNEIIQEVYNKLKTEGQTLPDSVQVHTFWEEKSVDGLHVTNYNSLGVESVNGNYVETYEGITRNIDTGSMVEYIYGEGTKKIVLETTGGIYIPFTTPTYVVVSKDK